MILEPPKIKSDTVSTVSPCISHEVMETKVDVSKNHTHSENSEGSLHFLFTGSIYLPKLYLVCWSPIFLGSKITTDGDCSHEIKRRLLLGRKVMTNLDSIFKSRDITLPTKVRLVKAMVFPVVMYGCESWTVKKAE